MKPWICLVLFICVPCCGLGALYRVHQEKVSFRAAQNSCNGFLTDVKDKQQAESIFNSVSEQLGRNGTFHFWIGLKKPKSCVNKNLPLKGFIWTMDNSTDSEGSQWKTEPVETCTTLLCGLLLVDFREGISIEWGFESKVCKEEHMFICKILAPPSSAAMEIKFFRVPDEPTIMEVRCPFGESKLTSFKADQELQLQNGSTIVYTLLCPECMSEHSGNHPEDCKDHCNQCTFSCIDFETSSVCRCIKGFKQSEDGRSCEKMSAAQEDLSSVSTIGPFHTWTVKMTPPATASGISTVTTTFSQHNTYGSKFNIFISVLVALSVLVVLVIVVLITIKCCLRKRSRKLTGKQELTSKESVDLRTTDSKAKDGP